MEKIVVFVVFCLCPSRRRNESQEEIQEHPIYECVTPLRYLVTLEQLILEHSIYECVTPLRYHVT